MSAGQSLRRQSYSFAPIYTPAPRVARSSTLHKMRIVVAVISAVALDVATFATIAMLVAGR